MQFAPKSKEEIQESKLIPKGVWPFEVFRAEDKVSKKAAARGVAEPDMIALEIYVKVNGKDRVQRAWLGSWNGGEELIYSFCESVGLVDLYLSGKLKSKDCLGMAGFVEIRHQDNEQYGAQSTAHLFIPAEGVAAVQAKIAEYAAKNGKPVTAAAPSGPNGKVPF